VYTSNKHNVSYRSLEELPLGVVGEVCEDELRGLCEEEILVQLVVELFRGRLAIQNIGVLTYFYN